MSWDDAVLFSWLYGLIAAGAFVVLYSAARRRNGGGPWLS